MFFRDRKLVTVTSFQEQVRVQEALAGAGIACSVRAWGTARALERQGRIGGSPAGEDVSYCISVRKGEYNRAADVLRSLRRGG